VTLANAYDGGALSPEGIEKHTACPSPTVALQKSLSD
jgi:hypothetical protein